MANTALRFVCSDCGQRADEPGDCDDCGEGSRVDSEDVNAVAVLHELDRQAVDRHRRLTTLVAVPTGMVVGAAASFVVPTMLPIPFGGPLQAVITMSLVAFCAMKILGAVWPARRKFGFLEGEMTASIRGEVGAMTMAEMRRPLMALAAFVVLGIGVGLFTLFQKRSAAEQELARRARASLAYANMQQCLLSDRLVAVSSLASQVRRIELAGNDPKKQDAWPRACASHVTALYEALDERGMGSQLKRALTERFACDEVCNPNEPALQMLGLADAAASAGLVDVDATVSGPTLLAERFITNDEMGQLAVGDATIRDRDYLTDGRARYLFSSRGQGLSYCELTPDQVSGHRCGPLSLPISASTAKLVADTADTVISGRARAYDPMRFFDTGGSAVALHAGKANGFTLTHLSKRKFRIDHVADGSVSGSRKLKMPKRASKPILIEDALLYTAPDDEDERWLYARKLRVEDDAYAADDADMQVKIKTERVRIGPAKTLSGTPQVCGTKRDSVLLFGKTLERWSLVFARDGEFSAPVAVSSAEVVKPEPVEPAKPKKNSKAQREKLEKASGFGMIGLLDSGEPGTVGNRWGIESSSKRTLPTDMERNLWADQLGSGERVRRVALPRYAFTCGQERAVVTWRSAIGDQQQIHQVRCAADGCTHERIDLSGIEVKTWWTAATVSAEDGASKVLLVWRDPQGVLRRRIAQLEHLAEAEDVRVMDSAEFGGPTTLDLEAIYGRRAVLFVFRGKGFHALRFAADGSTTPW